MAKRMTKAEQKAVGGLLLIGIVVGVPIYAVTLLGESVGWPTLIGGCIALLVARTLFNSWRSVRLADKRRAQMEARQSHLLEKYGDQYLVERIMSRMIWQDQTSEQLRDSLGDPVDTDEKVMKSRRREVWKYHPTGANRFSLRVTLDNGLVTGWDDKR